MKAPGQRVAPATTVPRICGAAFTSVQPRLSSRTPRRSAVQVSALQAGTQLIKKIASAARGGVFIVGGEGQIASRIALQLAASGTKVNSGFVGATDADKVLAFLKKYEVVSTATLSNIKPVDVDVRGLSKEPEAYLPKRSRILVVDGDVIGGRRVDSKLVSSALSAAQDLEASQFILVTNLPSGGGGGGFFGGGGSAGGQKLTRNEQAVISSGLNYVIVRAAGLDRVTDEYGESTNIVVGPDGSFPSSLVASKLQVAEVVAAALQQNVQDVVLEVAATSDAPAIRAARLVESTLAELRQGRADKEAAAQQAAKAKEVASPKPAGLFGRKAPVQVDEEEEDEEKPAPKPLFGFGGRRAQKEEEEEEEDEPEDKPGSFFTFGIKKPAAAASKKAAPSTPQSRGRQAPPPPSAAAKKAQQGTFKLFAGPQKRKDEEPQKEQAPKRRGFRLGRPSIQQEDDGLYVD